MFPYFILFPLLVVASIFWPVAMSASALQKKDDREIKTWLVYWLGFIIVTTLMAFPGLELIISLPFTIIGAVLVDLYYEAQLALVVILVNPKKRYLDVVVTKLDEVIDQHGEKISEVAKQYFNLASAKAQELYTQYARPTETKAK